jgi:hypothetical protein
MNDFVERLMEEERNLNDKISSLRTALNKEGFSEKIGLYQYGLLKGQLHAMTAYSEILSIRISDLVNGDSISG